MKTRLPSIIASALAASLLASLPATASAQSAQERLEARYDRALAAGYKALFLCSATANAEANGASRTPESIHAWELTGIQSPLDDIVRELEYNIVRRPSGQVGHVEVKWADDMPPRIAAYYGPLTGCSIMPVGMKADVLNSSSASPMPPVSAGERIWTKGETASAAMLAAGDAAFDGTYGEGSRTTAVLVIKDRALTHEKYAQGFDRRTPQRTWSVAKSIAATLVGMAVQSREYSVDDPILIQNWLSGGDTDPRNAITIDLALRMASGRYSDTAGNRTDPIYWGGTSVAESISKWPAIHKPGTVYRYANNDTLLAVKAIEQYLEYYSASALIRKVGMNDTVIETDSRGGYVLSSQVWSTADDLAKLGQLYLDNGVWDGERILPENWREYVSDPKGPQPQGTDWGYGAGWWTFSRPEGNAFDGIPDDAFAARGNRGQYVVVVPSRNVVIVRRGEDMVGTRFDIAAFTRDVLAALD
ncbi:MAG: serine hydrolase [Pseudomonadota bacterium]|nr:serine hydrolase [Pseudomonadota bacterium]